MATSMGGNRLAYINLGRYRKQVAGLKELADQLKAQLKERDKLIAELRDDVRALQGELNRRA